MDLIKLPNDELLVSGETFPFKTQLKEIGGKWNRSLKGWTFKIEQEGLLTKRLREMMLERQSSLREEIQKINEKITNLKA